jgi:hypothetical protein
LRRKKPSKFVALHSEIWKKYFEKFGKKNRSTVIINEQNKREETPDLLLLKNNPKVERLTAGQSQQEKKNEETLQLYDFTDLFSVIHKLLKRKEEEAYNKRIINSPDVKHIKELAL